MLGFLPMEVARSGEIVFYTPGKLASAYPYRIIVAGRNRRQQADGPITRCYLHHTFILTLSGAGVVDLSNRSFAANAGTIAWLDTSQNYAHRCHDRHDHWTYLWFGMQGFGLDTLFGRLPEAGNAVPVDIVPVQTLFEEVVSNLSRHDRSVDAISSAIGSRVVSSFSQPPSDLHQPVTASHPIQTAMKAFRADISAQWHVDRFASLANQSASHFHRQFREVNGVTPMEWVRQERINAAKYLLSTSTDRIAFVGRQCGYPDPYHFSREFTRLTGVTPRSFRRSAGG